MVVVQNRTSRALKLAGKLIHRWDKVEFEVTTLEQSTELAAAEERGDIWCTPSLLMPKPAPPPKFTAPPQQKVVLRPPKNHKR